MESDITPLMFYRILSIVNQVIYTLFYQNLAQGVLKI